ncbi:hypothetical protein GCM10023350_53210 [Nocardioides endophyticus]|uniref:Transposase n=1 Tax=Nocardioides endophyticus TaxID=1353775 RepID=A0ABP8ZM28_9ACTN
MLRRTRISALRPVREPDAEPAVEQRTLSDYDIALGIDLGADNDGAHNTLSGRYMPEPQLPRWATKPSAPSPTVRESASP